MIWATPLKGRETLAAAAAAGVTGEEDARESCDLLHYVSAALVIDLERGIQP